MIGVLVIQTILYVTMLSQGGLVSHIDNNSLDIFYRQTDNLGLYFENEMIHRWSNLGRSEEEVLSSVQSTLAESHADYEDIRTDAGLNEKIISNAAQYVIEMIRRNSVTGAFLILDGIGVSGEDIGGNRAAFYIRDNDPATYSEGNSDLLLERGLPSVAKENSLSLDSYWSALIYEGDSVEFFLPPLEEARKDSASSSVNYGYWSKPFRLSESDREAVAYTIPLISEDGQVFGVLGIDISVDYLTSKIKSNNYSQEEATFALALGSSGSMEMDTVAQDGKLIAQYFGSAGRLKIKEKLENDPRIVRMDAEDEGHGALYGSVRTIKLYNVNTPFEDNCWSIIGVQEESTLLQLSRQLRTLVYIISMFTFIIGAVAITLVVVSLTRPVQRLLSELERSDPVQTVELPRLGIKEIDRLSQSIEQLSHSVAESASRFSQIIQKTNVRLGVFEYQNSGSVAYCSKKLFDVLCWDNERGGDRYLDLNDFKERMAQLELYETNGDVSSYQIRAEDGKERWVSITSIEDNGNYLGVAVDITEQVADRRKIEYERDYDLLTKLHNRRAFLQDMERMFRHPERLKTAAILMWDLDNLKYINDTYGHDFGDKYIIGFANALSSAEGRHCKIARRSGDEFYLFFYGFDSKEEINREIAAVCRQVEKAVFRLPNGNEYKVRASGGIAWYPQDADNISDLIRYADFAMYSVKHTTKGAVEEFNPEEWRRNSLLVNGQEAFDRLIDHSMVDFAFQPILEVQSGRVAGYEALMRPQVPQFSDPEDVLRVARSQSKLFMVERLTMFGVMKRYARLVADGKIPDDCKVFINSLPNQILSEEDLNTLTREYGKLMSNVVLEITESEAINSEFQARKRSVMSGGGGEIAIDDYGTGYNSLSMLFRIVPDILKVDISIIHRIDTKQDNQKLLESIISYSHQRGIKVLAEGVETAGELAACIQLGVDYLQGYYLGRPKLEIEPVSSEILEEIEEAKKKGPGIK